MLREESWKELCRGERKAGGGRGLGWIESAVLVKEVVEKEAIGGHC